MGKQLEDINMRLKRSAMVGREVEEAESWDLSTIAIWTIGTIAASVLAICYTIPPFFLTGIGCALIQDNPSNCSNDPLTVLMVFIQAFLFWPTGF